MENETPDNMKIAVFLKLGRHLQSTLSIEANNIKDFAAAVADMEGDGLKAVIQMAKDLDDLTNEFFPADNPKSGMGLVKSELGGVVVSETQSGRKCDHGWMQYKTGQGAKGQWEAYFCPTPKGTPGQCKPVDAKTGKPWG